MTDFHESKLVYSNLIIWFMNFKNDFFKQHSLVNGKPATLAFKTIKLIVYVLKLNIFN